MANAHIDGNTEINKTGITLNDIIWTNLYSASNINSGVPVGSEIDVSKHKKYLEIFGLCNQALIHFTINTDTKWLKTVTNDNSYLTLYGFPSSYANNIGLFATGYSYEYDHNTSGWGCYYIECFYNRTKEKIFVSKSGYLYNDGTNTHRDWYRVTEVYTHN